MVILARLGSLAFIFGTEGGEGKAWDPKLPTSHAHTAMYVPLVERKF